MNPENAALNNYIEAQRQRNVSDTIIYQNLLSSGWPAETVATALGITTLPLSNVPVPEMQNYASNAINTPKTTSGFLRGRLSRLGFLLSSVYVLAYFLLPLSLTIIGHGARVLNIIEILMGVIGVIAVIPISISLHVRRWHDIDQSGWMTLLGFIPFIGFLVTIALLILPGTKGPNKFGAMHQASLAPKHIFGLR